MTSMMICPSDSDIELPPAKWGFDPGSLGKQGVINEINRAWGDNPNGQRCIDIFEYLCGLPLDSLNNIGSDTLRRGADCDDMPTLLLCAQYLIGAINILFPFFALVEEPGGQKLFLSTDEVKKAMNGGGLNHPKTGQPVLGWEHKACMFFKPGHNLLPFVDCVRESR